MKLTGSYKIPTDKQSVWEALNNPEILEKCIPGCEEFKKILILVLQQRPLTKLVHLMQVLPVMLNFKISIPHIVISS